jgi:UDP-N-acetylmuramate dehydrogenase
MMPALRHDRLIDRLPAARGALTENAPLASFAWFRVGGPAEVMFQPEDRDDLAAFLSRLDADIPVTVLGVGSNLLVRDGGIAGVVIRLGRAFASIEVTGHSITAGGAAMDVNVARAAQEAGLAGMEFLSGIPGTIGGALRMNAGAYGRETADVLVTAEAMDRKGALHAVDAAGMGYTYRHSTAPEDWIFTTAVLRGEPGDAAEIARRMQEIKAARQDSQPIRSRTGGSTFKNPPGQSAWKLIDEAGCRGLRRGAAQVSEVHCNFLINTGGATAAELEGLGEEVRTRVKDTSGIELEWEIARIGEPLPGGAA